MFLLPVQQKTQQHSIVPESDAHRKRRIARPVPFAEEPVVPIVVGGGFKEETGGFDVAFGCRRQEGSIARVIGCL